MGQGKLGCQRAKSSELSICRRRLRTYLEHPLVGGRQRPAHHQECRAHYRRRPFDAGVTVDQHVVALPDE